MQTFEQQALKICAEQGFGVTVNDDEDGYCIEINTRQTRKSILQDHWICFDQTCADAIKDDKRTEATQDELWEFVCKTLDTDINECDSDCDECESW